MRPLAANATSKRLGTITAFRHYSAGAAQPAPNAKAYLDSGVIKPQQNIDVKKVLVIGSGGLAIGQAGEFDYSGMSQALIFMFSGAVSADLIVSRCSSFEGP